MVYHFLRIISGDIGHPAHHGLWREHLTLNSRLHVVWGLPGRCPHSGGVANDHLGLSTVSRLLLRVEIMSPWVLFLWIDLCYFHLLIVLKFCILIRAVEHGIQVSSDLLPWCQIVLLLVSFWPSYFHHLWHLFFRSYIILSRFHVDRALIKEHVCDLSESTEMFLFYILDLLHCIIGWNHMFVFFVLFIQG